MFRWDVNDDRFSIYSTSACSSGKKEWQPDAASAVLRLANGQPRFSGAHSLYFLFPSLWLWCCHLVISGCCRQIRPKVWVSATDRLLAVTVLKQDALHDDQQKILLDEKGAPQFERLRTVLRKIRLIKGIANYLRWLLVNLVLSYWQKIRCSLSHLLIRYNSRY